MKRGERKSSSSPEPHGDETRKEKIERFRRMVQEKDGISDEKLDSVLAELIDSVEHD